MAELIGRSTICKDGESEAALLQVGREDDLNPRGESYQELEPRRKAMLWQDLRLKSRENNQVTLTQKAETLLQPLAEVIQM